jgi:hypothetical protein
MQPEFETEMRGSGDRDSIENVPPTAERAARRWATALGWLSLGLGAAGFLAPRRTARMLGIPATAPVFKVLRGIGLRELGVARGLLADQRRSAAWKWLRVGGDAMDLALLLRAGSSRRADRGRLAGAFAVVAGITTLDVVAAAKDSMREAGPRP